MSESNLLLTTRKNDYCVDNVVKDPLRKFLNAPRFGDKIIKIYGNGKDVEKFDIAIIVADLNFKPADHTGGKIIAHSKHYSRTAHVKALESHNKGWQVRHILDSEVNLGFDLYVAGAKNNGKEQVTMSYPIALLYNEDLPISRLPAKLAFSEAYLLKSLEQLNAMKLETNWDAHFFVKYIQNESQKLLDNFKAQFAKLTSLENIVAGLEKLGFKAS